MNELYKKQNPSYKRISFILQYFEYKPPDGDSFHRPPFGDVPIHQDDS